MHLLIDKKNFYNNKKNRDEDTRQEIIYLKLSQE